MLYCGIPSVLEQPQNDRSVVLIYSSAGSSPRHKKADSCGVRPILTRSALTECTTTCLPQCLHGTDGMPYLVTNVYHSRLAALKKAVIYYNTCDITLDVEYSCMNGVGSQHKIYYDTCLCTNVDVFVFVYNHAVIKLRKEWNVSERDT